MRHKVHSFALKYEFQIFFKSEWTCINLWWASRAQCILSLNSISSCVPCHGMENVLITSPPNWGAPRHVAGTPSPCNIHNFLWSNYPLAWLLISPLWKCETTVPVIRARWSHSHSVNLNLSISHVWRKGHLELNLSKTEQLLIPTNLSQHQHQLFISHQPRSWKARCHVWWSYPSQTMLHLSPHAIESRPYLTQSASKSIFTGHGYLASTTEMLLWMALVLSETLTDVFFNLQTRAHVTLWSIVLHWLPAWNPSC